MWKKDYDDIVEVNHILINPKVHKISNRIFSKEFKVKGLINKIPAIIFKNYEISLFFSIERMIINLKKIKN